MLRSKPSSVDDSAPGSRVGSLGEVSLAEWKRRSSRLSRSTPTGSGREGRAQHQQAQRWREGAWCYRFIVAVTDEELDEAQGQHVAQGRLVPSVEGEAQENGVEELRPQRPPEVQRVQRLQSRRPAPYHDGR